MKLHLGCGIKHIDGFINIDVRMLEGVDEVDDVNTLSKYAKDSINLIYACHVLEHSKRNKYLETLKRWHYILKDGGILRISVPDIEKVFLHYSNNKDLRILRGFLWGGQNYEQNFHYMGWDFKTLEEDLIEVGFKNISRYDWKITEHAHIDDFSQCYLPHMDKENGMLMSLNIEAIK
jgi:hypothetical protein